MFDIAGSFLPNGQVSTKTGQGHGTFVASVAAAGNCGILLDLHNVYCNERNGRTSIDAFIDALPLGRIWEVHLAGGEEAEGFWLDAHNGPMQRELAAKARAIIRALPNLGAITFEIYETFLNGMRPESLDAIVEELRDIWDQAGRASGDGDPRATKWPDPPQRAATAPDPRDWESALTRAVWQGQPDHHPFPEDQAAIRLYGRLARSFRGSMLLRALGRSLPYLMLRERDHGDRVLAQYFNAVPPKLYAPLEAKAFRDWATREPVADPLLSALLDYDLALLDMTADPSPREVCFPGDPRPVFEALAEARLPAIPEPPAWEVEILPDHTQLPLFRGADAGS